VKCGSSRRPAAAAWGLRGSHWQGRPKATSRRGRVARRRPRVTSASGTSPTRTTPTDGHRHSTSTRGGGTGVHACGHDNPPSPRSPSQVRCSRGFHLAYVCRIHDRRELRWAGPSSTASVTPCPPKRPALRALLTSGQSALLAGADRTRPLAHLGRPPASHRRRTRFVTYLLPWGLSETHLGRKRSTITSHDAASPARRNLRGLCACLVCIGSLGLLSLAGCGAHSASRERLRPMDAKRRRTPAATQVGFDSGRRRQLAMAGPDAARDVGQGRVSSSFPDIGVACTADAQCDDGASSAMGAERCVMGKLFSPGTPVVCASDRVQHRRVQRDDAALHHGARRSRRATGPHAARACGGRRTCDDTNALVSPSALEALHRRHRRGNCDGPPRDCMEPRLPAPIRAARLPSCPDSRAPAARSALNREPAPPSARARDSQGSCGASDGAPDLAFQWTRAQHGHVLVFDTRMSSYEHRALRGEWAAVGPQLGLR